MSLSLITDRTQADVDALKAILKKGIAGMTASELSAFNDGYKGGYDYRDYNRVGAAVTVLAGLLGNNGYSVSVTGKSNWTETDNITATARAAYLADLQTLKSAFYGTVDLPAAWDNLTFEIANNAEKLLLEIEWNIYCMMAGFFYSGEVYCGEV